MKLLGSRLLLLAAFFTFNSAYIITTSEYVSPGYASTLETYQVCSVDIHNRLSDPNSQATSSFEIAYKNEAVQITWEVERPKKGSFYMVQRSDDGMEWYTIGGFAIREQQSSKQDFIMSDANLKSKVYHYKLKEIRPDGSIVFSNALSVFAGYDKPLAIYPNPVENVLSFEIPSKLEEGTFIEVLDQNGRLLMKDLLQNPSYNKFQQLNIEDLPSGMYLIRVYTSDQRYTGRIIKK